MTPLDQALPNASPTSVGRRFAFADGVSFFLVLVVVCLGVLMTWQAVDEYRARQAAEARFAARLPQVIMASPNIGRIVPGAPYDTEFAERMAEEIVGFVVVLGLAIIARRRRGRRLRPHAETKWIAAVTDTSQRAKPRPPRAAPSEAASKSVAAERLSVVVWSDNVVRHERAHG